MKGIHLDDTLQPMPPPKPSIDYSHEASEYERKLIQVYMYLYNLTLLDIYHIVGMFLEPI